MALLKATNLTKYYEDTIAVNNVNFEFHEGTCTALIGPNGAGKTTILRILTGLLKPTSGSITFNGEVNTDLRGFIGYLPQFPTFHSWMTGLEALIFSAQISQIDKDEAKKRALVLLDKLGLANDKNKIISKYSGGMKQRLGIAQAIIHQPKVLLLDEPVSALDPIGRREILNLMEELKKEMSILFSTHILSDAEEISDELILLNKGEVIEKGPLSKILKKYHASTIELEFSSDIDSYMTSINSITSIIDSKIERNKLILTANNIEVARKELLTLAIQNDWQLTSFNINRTSLEDMFMRVVNQ